MPQPTLSDVHIDVMLTNMSQKYLQPETNFIADQVAPLCPVQKKTDKILKYDRADWFRDTAEPRAPGTQSRGGGFKIDTSATYSCEEWAWHTDIPDEIRANADSPLDMDMDAVQIDTQVLKIRREKLWASKFFGTGLWSNEWTISPSGYLWSDYTHGVPISDVETAKAAIAKKTGFVPNVMAMSYGVWLQLKNHPTVTDRYKYTSGGPITEEMVARLFGVDKIVVGQAVYTTSSEGATTSTFDFVLANNVLLTYVQPAPSLIRPSAGYIYSWRGAAEQEGLPGVGIVVRRYRFVTGERKDRVEAAIYEDYKLIEPDLGAFFLGAV
jgi:hypothetical protein